MKKVLIVLLYFASITAGDTIYLKGGTRPLDGVTITGDTWKEITYSVDEVPIQMTWDRVERVEYSNMKHSSYLLGEQYFKGGSWKEAIGAYGKTLKNKMLKGPWIKPYAYYKIGLCLYNLGKYNNAVKYFKGSVSKKDSHFEPDAYIMIGKSYLKMEEFDKAKEWINKVTEKYGKGKFSEARYVLIDVEFQAGDFRKAREKFQALRRKVSRRDINGFKIDIKIALCYMNESNVKRGRKKLAEVIGGVIEGKRKREYSDKEADSVLAEAYTAKGDSYFNVEGRDYEKACRAYLHSAVTYKDARNQAVSEAVYKAGICLFELLTMETDPEIRAQMIARAEYLLREGKEFFAGNSAVVRKLNKYLSDLPNE